LTDSQNNLDLNGLSQVLDRWMATPFYEQKLIQFLTIALQQKPTVGYYQTQLNRVGEAAPNKTLIRQNLQESFARTALRIIQNESDFREILTTQDWEVTTAVLTALAYADSSPTPRFAEFSYRRIPFRGSDFTDWRTVSLRLLPSRSPHTFNKFANNAYIANIRAVSDGQSFSLAAPRVGFFTTLPFFETWQTNADNQFRLNTNQTLITALGLTFTSGDPTLPNQAHLNDLDPNHAPAGSDCFGCHKNLDPMRNVFLNHFNPVSFRARAQVGNRNDFFAFQGQRSGLRDIYQFAQAVADHPHFAKGWTLRLCHWISSTSCADETEEIERIATVFRDSGYRFNRLIHELVQSPLITNTSFTEDTTLTGAHLSIARKDHFCSALSGRLQAVREARGFSQPRNPSFIDICDGDNNLRQLADAIPADAFARGNVELVLSSKSDLFLSRAYGKFCDAAAPLVVGTQQRHTFRTGNIGNSLNDMTEHLLGIPSSSPDYVPARDTLQRLYDVGRHGTICRSDQALETSLAGALNCGLGLNAVQSLRLAWINSCQSPRLTGVGL
jgi:hypothetical protein